MSRWDIAKRIAKREWNSRETHPTLADHIMTWGTIGMVLMVVGMVVSAL